MTQRFDSGSHDSALQLSKSELMPVAEQSNSSSALNALVNEAYEHPVRTGLGAAAVVGTAALLAYSASRGRNLNVLIIEDTAPMGKALRDAVTASGHKATWVSSISKLSPLTGLDEAGKEIALTGRNRFQLALVDGDLGKGNLMGSEIVPTLKQARITSIGTSTIPDFNVAMKANGAEIATGKPIIYTSLLGKTIDLKTAVRQPATIQSQLDLLTANFSKPESATLRKAADNELMAYIMGKKGG